MINMIEFKDDELFRKLMTYEDPYYEEVTGRIHPSSMGGCSRDLFLDMLPVEANPRPKQSLQGLHQANVGTLMHEGIQALAREILSFFGKKVRCEIVLDPMVLFEGHAYHIGGKYDMTIEDIDGTKELTDIKSVETLKYIDKPKHEHLLQVGYYMMRTGIDHGRLMYIQRAQLDRRKYAKKYEGGKEPFQDFFDRRETKPVCKEWTFDYEDVAYLVEGEIERLKMIADIHIQMKKNKIELPVGKTIWEYNDKDWSVFDGYMPECQCRELWDGRKVDWSNYRLLNEKLWELFG